MVSKKRSVIALRHVAFEDLGFLAPLLSDAGWLVSYCDVATADLSDRALDRELDGADLVVVLGGPISVYETAFYPFLSNEIKVIERRLAKDRPTLGICLGSQIMAKALGARVYAGHQKEIGWGRLRLTSEGIRSCLKPLSAVDAAVLHWHGDTFDLPRNAVRLASTDIYENQAFAYGSNALALQFHLEADERALEGWFVGHAVELAAAGISVSDLRATTAKIASRLESQAEKTLMTWIRQIDRGPQYAPTKGPNAFEAEPSTSEPE